MTLNRTGWLSILAVVTVGLGVCFALYWPQPNPSFVQIADASARATGSPFDEDKLSVAQRHTLGLKANLNRISEAELARLPGIGRLLAKNLVEARQRLQRFHSWEEVDAVRGVGPVKLKRLQELTEIRPE